MPTETMMAAAEGSIWEMPPEGPPISHNDSAAFFQSHFSPEAIADFGQTFQNPAAFQQCHQQLGVAAEDDDLGYYEDGVKRTLTDEQIDMFRQSELRDLRRRQERGMKSKLEFARGDVAKDGGQSQTFKQRSSLPSSTRSTKRKKKKGASNARYEPKPDLRKRTWDVVEAGLDTLDYD